MSQLIQHNWLAGGFATSLMLMVRTKASYKTGMGNGNGMKQNR